MMISFHNITVGVPDGATDHAIMAALFMNTGFTDQGNADKYFQSDWQWALPCDNLILDLDFSNAIDGWDAWGNPTYGPVTGLNEVSALGVLIGSNSHQNWGIADGEDFEICLDTIPAPGAIFLGSIGLGLVGWLRRRRTL
jgi:hypothetical protein